MHKFYWLLSLIQSEWEMKVHEFHKINLYKEFPFTPDYSISKFYREKKAVTKTYSEK